MATSKLNLILVYQAGIANLVSVPSFDAHQEGKNERVYQGDFRTAEAMARGARLAGAAVKIASCNRAGDILEMPWIRGLSDCPFRAETSAGSLINTQLQGDL